MMLGSGASLHRDQTAADIFWENIWTANGVVHRVLHVCVTWGISVVLVQTGVCPEEGKLPDVWHDHALSLQAVRVDDDGPENLDVHGAPAALPNANQINHGPNAFYVVDGRVALAKPVPWHHRVTVRPAREGETWHYHQCAPRKDHGPPPPVLPVNKGSHVEFTALRFSTQVQSYRTAVGVVRHDRPARD
ncbi:hypothetical protein L226DRAFT_469431 [Lentinus tigrinus ALCF2SS1-7]|uniref:Uncharacterized protein n=1 Tax=Lentinus tigrinus ALCF2SS1-6 TaxID=1328759 RepID=A0A5C2S9T5_9APHY|nr:hypothetical protein L227DRAFT_502136 [Lentinus tigrinus ALCF2SS1-6]RPD70976.1 hypothetical protein L226DRAFT_469431 [Lentinus tigrinus ALCF2SS1-7]